jgi:DNA-directed RNA polymerase subunit K/omega
MKQSTAPTTNMITPSTEEMTQGRYNRYTLVIAVAKCARMVTDEYVKQRENAERLLAQKETDKSLASLIKKEFRDEKSVRTAINRLQDGTYKIVDETVEQSDSVK